MNDTPQAGPREILTPFRPIPLDLPEGMKHNEFFNSTENLNDLVNNNGLLVNEENLLLYRNEAKGTEAKGTGVELFLKE